MNTVNLIKSALEKTFQGANITVFDDKAEHIGHAHQDSGHFTIEITSPVFEGKNPIERHRLVYAALGTLMQTHIHALRIKANI